jgi:hypothetical protein
MTCIPEVAGSNFNPGTNNHDFFYSFLPYSTQTSFGTVAPLGYERFVPVAFQSPSTNHRTANAT